MFSISYRKRIKNRSRRLKTRKENKAITALEKKSIEKIINTHDEEQFSKVKSSKVRNNKMLDGGSEDASRHMIFKGEAQ